MNQFARPGTFARPAAMPGTPAAAPIAPVKSIFSRIAESKASASRLAYMKLGSYLMRIDSFKEIASTRKGMNGIGFEHTCIHVFDDKQGRGHSVGESCSNMQWSNNEGWEARIKGALCQITGYPEEAMTEQFIEQILKQRMLDGSVVSVENYGYTTKKNANIICTNYKGIVPFADLPAILSDKEKAMFFPNGALEQFIKQEQEAAPQG